MTGQPVTLTTPVTPASGAAALPTGTLTFAVNGTTVTCSSPGHAQHQQPAHGHLHRCPRACPAGPTSSRPPTPATRYAASIGSLSLTVAKAATTVNGLHRGPASGSVGHPGVGPDPQVLGQLGDRRSPRGPGTPTGTVAITTPSTAQTLCTITLVNGAGSCFDTSVQVPSGTRALHRHLQRRQRLHVVVGHHQPLTIGPEKALVTGFTTSPATPVTTASP